MKHRERVLLALDHKEPDRIPIDLGSVGSLMVDSVYFEVKKLLGIDTEIEPYRHGSTANYYDERVLEALDIDFRHIWFSSPDKPKPKKNDDGTYTDEWGITWSEYGSYPKIFPLQDSSYEDLKKYPFPSPGKDWDVQALKDRAEHLASNTDYAIVAKEVVSGGGILERSYYLRGVEQLFSDMYLNEKLAHELIGKVAEIEIAYWDIFLDAVGPYIDIVQRASDLGTQLSLIISPEHYRKYLKPFEKKIFDFIKSKAPQVKIWFHSCGAVSEIIDDFIDIGVDILNPVQPLAAGMESFELKKRFGDRICFHGGIDLQRALIGSIDDVRKEVEKRISAFAVGGGYILSSSNHIQDDTPPENVIYLFEYAKEFGKYPIEAKLKI
jgi:uroporphyrinogen decarboxylase